MGIILADKPKEADVAFSQTFLDFCEKAKLSTEDANVFFQKIVFVGGRFSDVTIDDNVLWMKKMLTQRLSSLREGFAEHVPAKKILNFVALDDIRTIPTNPKESPVAIIKFWSDVFRMTVDKNFFRPAQFVPSLILFKENIEISGPKRLNNDLVVYATKSGHLYVGVPEKNEKDIGQKAYVVGSVDSDILKRMSLNDFVARVQTFGQPGMRFESGPDKNLFDVCGVKTSVFAVPKMLMLEKMVQKTFDAKELSIIKPFVEDPLVSFSTDATGGVQINDRKNNKSYFIGKNIPDRWLGGFIAIKGRLPFKNEYFKLVEGRQTSEAERD